MRLLFQKPVSYTHLDVYKRQPSRVAVVIEGGICKAAFSSDPNIRIEITELDDAYATSEQRDAAYQELLEDKELISREYTLFVPGFEESDGVC